MLVKNKPEDRSRSRRTLALIAAFALAIAGCSAPQLAYNNADTLLRFKLYDYLAPTQDQDVLMSQAIARFHTWHRHQELPQYVDTLGHVARRVEAGLQEEDVRWARDTLRAHYRRLAARAYEEALPTLRTLTPENFEALEDAFRERNEDYADDYLQADPAERREAMVEWLQEHLERWTDDLNAEQLALVGRFVDRHPDFAQLRLDNRKSMQARMLAQMKALAQGQTDAESRLRDLVVNWEEQTTPQYRQALRAWEQDLTRTLVALDRQLAPAQRTVAVTRLREYGSELQALAGDSATRAAALKPSARATP